jgi:hypothetical protein
MTKPHEHHPAGPDPAPGDRPKEKDKDRDRPEAEAEAVPRVTDPKDRRAWVDFIDEYPDPATGATVSVRKHKARGT